VQCKRELAENINAYVAEFRERYRDISSNPARVREILGDGAHKAASIADEVLRNAKEAIGIA
jgi:tryptophanyl-tRNA synthetase